MRGNPQTHPQAGKVDGMDRATRSRAARALQWEAKRVFVQSELLHFRQGMVNPRSSLDWDRLLQ